MWWDPNGTGWWVAYGIATLCWLTTFTLIAWAVIRVGGDRGRTRQGEKSPVEIAQQRLAQGEITQKQFDDLKKSLG